MDGDGPDNRSDPDSGSQSASTPAESDDGVRAEGAPELGAILGDRYRIDDQIEVGGMGVIYRATELERDRTVVVKLMSQKRMEDDAAVHRFEREARTLARLDHPKIVTIHEFGSEEDVSYIVMEYVEGTRLDEFVEQRGGVGAGTFVSIADQVLDAIAEAHRRGVVHRDVKPSNIMLTDGAAPNSVKVLDFGLAKPVSGDEDVTKQDNLVGSMPYLAPEQIQGADADQCVDVYALGVVFYYMLSGRKPFRGSNASILYDHVNSDPPPLPLHVSDAHAVPREIFEFVRNCLQKQPEDRPADAAVARKQLETIAREASLGGDLVDGGASGAEYPPMLEPTDAGPGRAESGEAPGPRSSAGGSEVGPEATTPNALEAAPTDVFEGRQSEGAVGRSGSADDSQDAPESADASSESEASWSTSAMLVSVGALLLVGGTAFWFTGARETPEAPGESTAGVRDASSASEGSGSADVGTAPELAAVESLLDRGEVRRAAEKLRTYRAEAEHPARHEATIAALQERLEIAQLYRAAREARDAQRYGDAKQKLREVLRRDPDHRRARSLLESLAEYARIEVESPEGAKVVIDGTDVGRAPALGWVEPGEHEVELRRSDRVIWSKRLRAETGEKIHLRPEVDSKSPGTPPAGE